MIDLLPAIIVIVIVLCICKCYNHQKQKQEQEQEHYGSAIKSNKNNSYDCGKKFVVMDNLEYFNRNDQECNWNNDIIYFDKQY